MSEEQEINPDLFDENFEENFEDGFEDFDFDEEDLEDLDSELLEEDEESL